MKRNIMLDLETMGNSATSSIVSIGAVSFDGDGLGDEFYVNIDLQSCLDIGLTVDGSTVQWWLSQSDEARKALTGLKHPIKDSLKMLFDFIDKSTCGHEELQVWGNGASFDNSILSNAYRKAGMLQPWRFWNDRCYRTVKNMFMNVPFERVGTHHNALDDAKSQALHLINIIKTEK